MSLDDDDYDDDEVNLAAQQVVGVFQKVVDELLKKAGADPGPTGKRKKGVGLSHTFFTDEEHFVHYGEELQSTQKQLAVLQAQLKNVQNERQQETARQATQAKEAKASGKPLSRTERFQNAVTNVALAIKEKNLQDRTKQEQTRQTDLMSYLVKKGGEFGAEKANALGQPFGKDLQKIGAQVGGSLGNDAEKLGAQIVKSTQAKKSATAQVGAYEPGISTNAKPIGGEQRKAENETKARARAASTTPKPQAPAKERAPSKDKQQDQSMSNRRNSI